MRGKETVFQIAEKLVDLFWQIICPPHCVICEKVLKLNKFICVECRTKLPFVEDMYCLKCGKPVGDDREYCTDCKKREHYFTRGVSVWSYSPMLKKSLYRFKYNNKRYYAKYYTDEIVKRYSRLITQWGVDIIIPVPLYKKKKRRRGYNQAEILANELSSRISIPLDCRIVTRIRDTLPQKMLNDMERQKNLKGAFKINKSVIELKKILLIDDIFTTGSTVDEIARVLLEAGANSVYVVTLCIGRGY